MLYKWKANRGKLILIKCAWTNQRVVNLSSGVTEQTSVASQARAKLMALTSNIREISPTAILVRHNCNIYKKTLLHFEDTRPWRGSVLWAVVTSLCTASVPLHRMPALLPKDPIKVKSMPFFAHINKIHGEITFPTEERTGAGLSDAVRSFLWTGKGPRREDSPDYQGLQSVPASFGDACFRVLGFPGEKATSVAADWLFWKWLKSLVCVSVRTLWRERKWKASCKHLE